MFRQPLDSETLERWYELYGYAVSRRCARLLGSDAEADDALQEVFLRAHRYGRGLRGEQVLSWLMKVSDNHCFDRLRRRPRAAEPTENAPVVPAEQHATDGESPERVRLVAQVLAACKPRVREAAVLYFVDELTQDEVATQLGVSRKTVKEKLAQFREVAAKMLGIRSDQEVVE